MTCIHSNCNCLNNKIAEVYNLQAEVTRLRNQIVASHSQLNEKQCQISFIQNDLKNTQQQMLAIRSELGEKQDQIVNLSNQLTELKLENNSKDIELKHKDDEIEALKKNVGGNQKGFLSEELKSKQEKLETFAAEIGVGLSKVQNLRKRYRELILAQEENRGNDIAVVKENIEATKEGLIERGINSSKVQKFCKECKKVARLEV
jgi:chromosome segregation ATPase